MANTTTIATSWTEGSVTGKRRVVYDLVFVADGTKGALANDLPASLFSPANNPLSVIEEITGGTISTNATVTMLQPSYDRKSAVCFDATFTAANVPAGTYKIMVKGY